MGCESCSGGCGGCARELTLTEAELELLNVLAQIPFLPVARKMEDALPIYLEDDAYRVEEYALILQCLEKKGLISLDFDRPLKNVDVNRYKDYPILGSMALTARGQSVLELLEIQGLN